MSFDPSLIEVHKLAHAEGHVGRKQYHGRPSLSRHKFKVGQLVYCTSRESVSGLYEVTQLLPPEGGEFQYRIKNAKEPHERLVKEHELEGTE
jgi:hypothetical protein